MNRNAPGSPADAPAPVPPGYVPLRRAGPEPSTQVGCTFLLGIPLTLLGAGIFSVFFLDSGGDPNTWVSLLVGGGFGAVGLLLLFAGIKGKRGLSVPRTEVYLQEGVALRPGVLARVIVRQPGPASLDSLDVRLLCERVYRRVVSEKSRSTVEDRERLVEQELVSLRGTVAPAGGAIERDAVLTIPPDAPPDGPAVPDGTIRWSIEVVGDAGVMRAIFHSFRLAVGSAGEGRLGAGPQPAEDADGETVGESAAEPAGGGETATAAPGTGPAQSRGDGGKTGGCGCLAIGAGFLFCGATFIWLYFNAETARGNPLVGLIGGIVFSLLGVGAIAFGLLGLFGRKRR